MKTFLYYLPPHIRFVSELLLAAAPNAVNAVGSVISSFSGNHSLTAQRHAAERLAERQAEINYDTWLKQNEYNTPVKQRMRLEDAGLNPLFYGLDGNSAANLQPANLAEANQAMAQQQGNAETRRATIMNAINAGIQNSINALVAESQANKNDSEAKLADEQANLTRVNTQANELALPGIEHDVASKKYDSIFKQIQAELSLNQFNNPEIRKSLVEMPKYEREKLVSEIALLDAEKLLRHADIEVDAAKINEIATQSRLNKAQLAVVSASAFQLQKLGELYRSQKITEVQFRQKRLELLKKQIKDLTNSLVVGSKDIDWYEIDKIAGYITGLGNAFYGKGKK